ncbi:hypothetical protein GGQ57_003352, partial [Parabacteroides faecis]|nr:hypothetical protein [Parabacteroides faecis]
FKIKFFTHKKTLLAKLILYLFALLTQFKLQPLRTKKFIKLSIYDLAFPEYYFSITYFYSIITHYDISIMLNKKFIHDYRLYIIWIYSLDILFFLLLS